MKRKREQMVNLLKKEIFAMKKMLALVLAALIVCSFASALAETQGMPSLDSFAKLTTKTEGDVICVKLSKPVDKLYANWPAELTIKQLAVSSDLYAYAITTGHRYLIGVAKVNDTQSPRRAIPGFPPVRPGENPPAPPAGDPPAQPGQNPPAPPAGDPPAQPGQNPPAPPAGDPPARPGQNPPARPPFLKPMQTVELATATDRAFVTLQGNWIVSYSRAGAIVDITYTETGDIQDIRDVAFLYFRR